MAPCSLTQELDDPEMVGTDSDSDMDLLERGTATPGWSSRQRGLLFGIMSVCLVALGLGTWAYGARPRKGGTSTPFGDFLQEWGKRHPHAGGDGGDDGHHGHAGLHAVDTDGDGQVDSGEVEALCERVSPWVDITALQCQEGFEMADANKDDVLDEEEVQPFLHELWHVAGPGNMKLAKKAWRHHGHVMKELKEIDRDGDGELAGEELSALAEKLEEHFDVSAVYQEALKAADGNGDGKLQRSEVPKLFKVLCEANREAYGDEDDDGDDGKATADGSDLPGFAI